MVRPNDKQPGVLRSLDWWTIGIYLALLIFGWLSVCGASFTYGDTDIFSLETRSGMQIVWIGTSVCLGFVILMLDSAQPVYITGYSGGDTTKNSAFIELGSNRYSSYGNTYTDNGYSNWANYGGERVCVAVSNCGIPMAIDVVIEPIAGQSRLLYVVE